MFTIEKGREIDSALLQRILSKYNTAVLPGLIRRRDYYEGRHAIAGKTRDTGKPCNRIVVNYCNNIVENFLGYITGIPIQYTAEGFDELLDILDYNDTENEDSELLRQALIYGQAFEIVYIDADGKQRFSVLESTECIPVYDTTIEQNVTAVIRYWQQDLADDERQKYIVEVYDEKEMRRYECVGGFSGLTLTAREPHYFGIVPITVFDLNRNRECVFGQVISLQDAYNSLLSDEVDDFDAFADAYLVMKGVSCDDEELDKMKKYRCMQIDADASVEYLTKSISDTQIQNMLQNVNDQIHKISACPDFNDEKFMAQSGIAMRYKLTAFENRASAIESSMRKALVRRIELLAAIQRIKTDSVWAGVDITFTRNLPTNDADIAQVVNALRGLVSDETLLKQLPIVDDVKEELARVKAQKEENMLNIDRVIRTAADTGEEDDENGVLAEP